MTGLQQKDSTCPFDLCRTKTGHKGLALFHAVGTIWVVPQMREQRYLDFLWNGSATCRTRQFLGKEFEGSLLTNAAQALLPNAHQHDVAEVAVGGFLEVLHGPGMPPIPRGALQG